MIQNQLEPILTGGTAAWTNDEYGRIKNAFLAYLDGMQHGKTNIMQQAAQMLADVPAKREISEWFDKNVRHD